MTAELLLAFLLALASSFFFSRRRQKKPNLPPGPFKFPIVGNLPQLISMSHRSLSVISRRYGPLMHLQVGRSMIVVASSTEMAREVTKTHDAVFASRPLLTVTKHLLYGCKDVAFAPYGEHWRQARKVCVLHLLSSKRVRSYRSVREDEVASLTGEISRQSSLGVPVDLRAMVHAFSSGVVSRVALGRKYPEHGQLIDEAVALLGESFIEDFFPRLTWVSRAMGKHDRVKRCFKELDSFLDEVIEEHTRSHRPSGEEDEDGGRDFVDVMLALQKDEEAKIFLTRDCMKAILLDMFAAGTETSGVTIEWAMSELVRSPTLMRKAQDEVRAIAGTKFMVAEDDLDQMSYVKAVIKESLRLHPPGPLLVPRESIKEAEISGFTVPEGARVLVNVWAIGRDPMNWEAPEEFIPERFLNGSAPDYKGQDFRYLPFGAGRRMCPGVAFASCVMELSLANLLHRFDWKLPEGISSEDLDMTEAAGISVPRKTRLLLVAVPKDMKG